MAVPEKLEVEDVQPSQGRETLRARLTKEFKAFARVSQIPVKSDPLKWWAIHAPTYPLLSQIAKRVLAIPASSAPAERLFGKLARINAKDRCSMSPDLVEAILMA